MYSIVLLAATAAGPNTPASDHTPAVAPVAVGCCGGTVVAGCTGYVASCYGSCHGGRVGIFHRHKHNCNGCSGSCTGWSCFGSCNGCWGSYSGYSYGCWGSCHGGGYSYGCWGSSNGCWGSSYGYGGYIVPAGPAVVIPVETPPAPKSDPAPSNPTPKSGASLRFQLPPTAVLFVDGRPAAGEGAERSFFTPPLQAGQRYFYDVKAELLVNGQTVVEEKRVVVTSGADVVESFPRLIAAAANPAAVAGR